MHESTNAEHHAKRAHRFYEAGHWHLALAELKLALSIDPDQPDWYVGLGLTLEAMERYDEAIDAFQTVLELRGEDPQTLLHLGIDLIRANQPAQAVGVLDRIDALEPHHLPAHAQRILAYALLGQHEDAELYFYLARQLMPEDAPDDPACLDHMAHSFAMRGEFARAIACWQQTAEQDTGYPGVHANLARALWRDDRPTQAWRAFRRHLAHEPEDVQAMTDLARLMISLDHPEQAERQLREAAALDPDNAAIHHALGELALSDDRLDAADSRLRQAMLIEPSRAGVRLALSRVARRQNKPQTRARLLLNELACDGHTPSQALTLAEALLEVGEPGRAAAFLQHALHTEPLLAAPFPDQAEAEFLFALACLELNHADRAVRALRRATKLDPNHPDAYALLVQTMLRQGQARRATATLRSALLHHPHDRRLIRLNRRAALDLTCEKLLPVLR